MGCFTAAGCLPKAAAGCTQSKERRSPRIGVGQWSLASSKKAAGTGWARMVILDCGSLLRLCCHSLLWSRAGADG